MSIIVLKETTKNPISLIGEMSGICWGSDTKDIEKNYKRGLECIENNHGRTLEFPQIYIEISGYSARVMREIYTHIGGSPTRLQASTRYINYNDFIYVTPPQIEKNEKAKAIYDKTMKNIAESVRVLEEDCGIKREDAGMLLPLGMESKMVMRTNLRQLIDMSHQRMCGRAYHEFQKLMKDLVESLSSYSIEWNYLLQEKKIFVPKCEELGYCPEKYSCGRIKANKKERNILLDIG